MSDIEYLYARAYGGRESSLIRFRITKRTAKRVYYLRKEEIVDARGELIETFGGIILISGKDNVLDLYIARNWKLMARYAIAVCTRLTPIAISTLRYRGC